MKSVPVCSIILPENKAGRNKEMITLKNKIEIIISAYRDGESERSIARRLELHRITVKKYIQEYEKKLLELSTAGEIHERREIIGELLEKPKYKSAGRRASKGTEEVKEKIRTILKENEEKAKSGRRKQQMKGVDIHKHLKDSGYDISYPTVANIVRAENGYINESFIKQDYEYGEVCEFDWGEVKLSIGGAEYKKYNMAAFATGKGFRVKAYIFEKQETQSFLEAHAEYFEDVGGVYKTMVYDNMKVAVKKFVGRNEKEPTEALLKLSLYYGFRFRFCNVRRGNEKGHVERSVEIIRRAAFAHKDRFENLEEVNSYLAEKCKELNQKPKKYNEGKSAEEIFLEEKKYLHTSKPKYECGEKRESRVDKYSTIFINTNHYSVPEEYTGKMVDVIVYSNKLYAYYEGIKIAEYDRAVGNGKWQLTLEHYLKTLSRKSGALNGSVVLKQAAGEIRSIYEKYFIQKPKDFVELLSYMKEKNKSMKEIEKSIEIIRKITPFDISKDKIIAVCEKGEEHRPQNSNNTEEHSKALLREAELLKEAV
jgi:transposase